MVQYNKFVDDPETSIAVDNVGPVTKEESDMADEFLEELFNGGEINGKL